MSDRESELRHATLPSCGLVKFVPIALSSLYLATGAALGAGVSTSSPLGMSVFLSTPKLRCASFHASADETVFAYLTVPVPLDFRNMESVSGRKPSLELWLRAKKTIVSGTPTDNDNLKMLVASSIQSPTLNPTTGAESTGTAVLTGADEAVMPAQSAATAVDSGSKLFKFDLLKGMTDANRKLVAPGGTIGVRISPHEAVGTALQLDFWDLQMVYIGHVNPPKWVDKDVQA